MDTNTMMQRYSSGVLRNACPICHRMAQLWHSTRSGRCSAGHADYSITFFGPSLA